MGVQSDFENQVELYGLEGILLYRTFMVGDVVAKMEQAGVAKHLVDLLRHQQVHLQFIASALAQKEKTMDDRPYDAGASPPEPQQGAGIHPAPIEFTEAQLQSDPILRYFHYAHLPPKLQETSKAFFDLATRIVTTLPRNAERTVALRKLLEAKDAGVRANLG